MLPRSHRRTKRASTRRAGLRDHCIASGLKLCLPFSRGCELGLGGRFTCHACAPAKTATGIPLSLCSRARRCQGRSAHMVQAPILHYPALTVLLCRDEGPGNGKPTHNQSTWSDLQEKQTSLQREWFLTLSSHKTTPNSHYHIGSLLSCPTTPPFALAMPNGTLARRVISTKKATPSAPADAQKNGTRSCRDGTSLTRSRRFSPARREQASAAP